MNLSPVFDNLTGSAKEQVAANSHYVTLFLILGAVVIVFLAVQNPRMFFEIVSRIALVIFNVVSKVIIGIGIVLVKILTGLWNLIFRKKNQ